MTSTFANRLDFLMRLTNTQNSMLARTLNFDASYISRIRSGRRGMPRHQPFVEPSAAYFARSLHEPYQRKAAADAICPNRSWPTDPEAATALIVSWLNGEESPDDPVDRFLGTLAEYSRQPDDILDATDAGAPSTAQPRSSADASFFYGDAGKRDAVEALLSELVALGKPVELLLFSDEHMAWLYDSPTFERRWMALLEGIISQGGHISIIHTLSRDLNQMLEAIEGWLPLYMTGAIEPWWYPRVRDGVYRRTLFLARRHGAIVSSSVGDDTNGMLNVMTHDGAAVAALEKEYGNYVALCKPLMRFEALRTSGDAASWLLGAARAMRENGADVMLRDATDRGFALFAQAGSQATLFSCATPSTAIIAEEHAMVASFWEYLARSKNVMHGCSEVADELERMAADIGGHQLR